MLTKEQKASLKPPSRAAVAATFAKLKSERGTFGKFAKPSIAPQRQFKVFIYAANSRYILAEHTVLAPNMALARQPFIDQGIEGHRIYALDVTK